MRVLLTGAAGYTGRGVAEILRTQHMLRGLDITAGGDVVHEAFVGDLTDINVCRAALAGMEALVLCHMARNPEAYTEPPVAFDVNVKGTANLYHAAVEQQITRCVLISTTDVIDRQVCSSPVPGDGPYNFRSGLYGLTKVLQEGIARHFYDKHQLATAIIRPAWIVYDGTFITKYQQRMERYDPADPSARHRRRGPRGVSAAGSAPGSLSDRTG